MNKLMYKTEDILSNVGTEEEWKVVMVDDEHDQLIISHTKYGLRVVNMSNLEVDYTIVDKHE